MGGTLKNKKRKKCDIVHCRRKPSVVVKTNYRVFRYCDYCFLYDHGLRDMWGRDSGYKLLKQKIVGNS